MPVYNAERFLADTIDSVLAQSFSDFEFLIHDDGSSDSSLAVLKTCEARDSRITVTSGPNRGTAAARNLLQSRARGEFLAVVDADDICYPDRFERQIAHLDAHPEIAVLGAFVRFMDVDGRPILNTQLPTAHDAMDACNLEGRTSIMQPTVMMRRAAVLEVGGYDESFRTAEDLDLWLRMAERFEIANYPAVLVDYRFHPSSLSGKRDIQTNNNMRARRLAAERRGLPVPNPAALETWRPAPDRKSQRDFALKWAWQAWNSGYLDTSRHYFLKALTLDPFSRDVWKGIFFGLLRRKKALR